MLIALLIAFFVSSGGAIASPLLGDPARLKSSIHKHVSDPARRHQLDALVAEVKAADEAAAAGQERAATSVEAVASRQAATVSELEAVMKPLLAAQRAARDRQVELRLRLASLTTPAEWDAIVGEAFPAKASPVPPSNR